MMRRFLFLLAGVLMISGCGVSKYTPEKNETKIQYVYKDSTVIKDSLRIVDLPVERIVDVIPACDTLKMETSLAKATAYVDVASRTLRGSIENKKNASLNVQYKERIVYRDSLHTKEVPVPYEVEVVKTKYPTEYWVLLAFFVGVLGKTAIKIINAKGWLKNFFSKLAFWKKKK